MIALLLFALLLGFGQQADVFDFKDIEDYQGIELLLPGLGDSFLDVNTLDNCWTMGDQHSELLPLENTPVTNGFTDLDEDSTLLKEEKTVVNLNEEQNEIFMEPFYDNLPLLTNWTDYENGDEEATSVSTTRIRIPIPLGWQPKGLPVMEAASSEPVLTRSEDADEKAVTTVPVVPMSETKTTVKIPLRQKSLTSSTAMKAPRYRNTAKESSSPVSINLTTRRNTGKSDNKTTSVPMSTLIRPPPRSTIRRASGSPVTNARNTKSFANLDYSEESSGDLFQKSISEQFEEEKVEYSEEEKSFDFDKDIFEDSDDDQSTIAPRIKEPVTKSRSRNNVIDPWFSVIRAGQIDPKVYDFDISPKIQTNKEKLGIVSGSTGIRALTKKGNILSGVRTKYGVTYRKNIFALIPGLTRKEWVKVHVAKIEKKKIKELDDHMDTVMNTKRDFSGSCSGTVGVIRENQLLLWSRGDGKHFEVYKQSSNGTTTLLAAGDKSAKQHAIKRGDVIIVIPLSMDKETLQTCIAATKTVHEMANSILKKLCETAPLSFPDFAVLRIGA